ncbi:MAG: TlpA disulfide reductase family protein [Bryobacteraceae bacterium]
MKYLLFSVAMLASASTLVNDVRESIARNDLPRASEMIRGYRASKGVTPEAVEALSWMARAELAQKNLVQADKYAQETYKLALEQQKTHPLAHDSNLQIALGAAIEVEANVLTTRGQRSEAITYLEEQLKTYYAMPFRARIQKNINLLSLEGKRAPALERATIPSGKPVMLFFWAHWCGDCKYEGPILARIKAEFVPKGLVFIAPTQKYGYVAGGEEAPPAVELRYIDQVRQQYYGAVIDAPAPVSEENFNKYGASTVPTLVLIDRAGIVRTYHPGVLSYEELHPRVEALFK